MAKSQGESSKNKVLQFFNDREEVLAKSAKTIRTPLKQDVISYHYTDDAKTKYEIKLDGEIILGTGEIQDVKTRRGFSLTDGKNTVYLRTMADVREYARLHTDLKAQTPKVVIKLNVVK